MVNCRPLRLRYRRLSVDRVAELLPSAVVDQLRFKGLLSMQPSRLRASLCLLAFVAPVRARAVRVPRFFLRQ